MLIEKQSRLPTPSVVAVSFSVDVLYLPYEIIRVEGYIRIRR